MTAVLNIMHDEEERKLIQSAYRKLLRSIKTPLEPEDRRMIRQAYELAVQAHSEQRRKSGEPYILHPIAVARICSEEIGLGATAVVCALLHDVVEDTNITLTDIERQFGSRVAKIVDGLTKLDSAYNSDSPQAENFKKVLSTLVEDVRVVLIKMADRLHNMRTLGSMPQHKQLKIAAETSYIYAPLAHRLGLYAFRTEFLDLCMKITDPDNYFDVAQKLKETKRSREKYINEFITPLLSQLDELNVPYKIFGRPKSIYSIYNKLRSKQVSFDEIYDLFAVRIVLDVPARQERMMCWQAYSVVTDVHRPIPERLKDWITVPKSNGYESLHTTVIGPKGRFVEVQIRTERMDEIAERGFAAHWKYKGVNGQQDVYERWLDSVRETLEDPTSDPVQFIGDFRSNNLFNEEVYVYTPKGDMRILPKGATALDFAFHIHSDVGYHCLSIHINNKLVPMSYVLENGDQINVVTHRNQKPNENWLKMVTTGKAKSKIRTAMREERKRKGELGREALERKFKNAKLEHTEEAINLLLKTYNLTSAIDLYFFIAEGEITIADIFKKFQVDHGRLTPAVKPSADQPPSDGGLRPTPGKPTTGSIKPRLLINGEPADQYDFSLATCCNPLPGDQVFAYLTANAGLKIHRINCPNSGHLMANYGYRVMKAEWVYTGVGNFVADLKITGMDKGPGVIEQLTHAISSHLGINIRSLNIAGKDGYYEAAISLNVASTNQLNQVIHSLKNMDIVSTVARIE